MHTTNLEQNKFIENILSLHSSGKLHHALLISGVKDSGKFEVLKTLADRILDNKTEYNPDLFLYSEHLDQDNPSIHVDIVRNIIDFASKTAYLGKNKVIVLPNIEYLNQSAANAFLKILEEPPKNVYFLLSCNNLKNILLTLRSRCYKLRSPVLDSNKYINEDLYMNIISELQALDSNNLCEISANLEKLKYKFNLVLDILFKTMSHIMQFKLKVLQDNNVEHIGDIKKLAGKYTLSQLSLASKEISLVSKYLSQNMHLNKRSSIEGILYKLCS